MLPSGELIEDSQHGSMYVLRYIDLRLGQTYTCAYAFAVI